MNSRNRGRPEPVAALFGDERDHWRDGWYALYAWRRTLGIAKWLCGIDGAEQHFQRALEAEWEGWLQARPEDAARDFRLRWEALSQHLALALAAGNPLAGLHFRSAAGIKQISADQPTLLVMGQWACLNLEAGNGWSAELVNDAAKMLRGTLWPELLSQGRYTEVTGDAAHVAGMPHAGVRSVEEHLLAEKHVGQESFSVDGAKRGERKRRSVIERGDRRAEIVGNHLARQERVDPQLAVRLQYQAVGGASHLLDAAQIEPGRSHNARSRRH